MTKIKFGLIVTDGRGKLGGHVLAKNRSGNYIRTKVTPVNPQTTFQQNQRASLGTLSSGWSGLTPAQRAAWDAAVPSFQKTDVFGDLRTPTGKNLYTGLNRNRLNAGQSVLVSPPSPATIPNVVITSATATVGTTAFPIVNTGTTTGATIQAWATPAMSQGTTFTKQRRRFLASFAGGAPATIDIWTAYVARFGTPVIGDNIVVSLRVVNAGGEAGVQVSFKATIAA